MMHGTPGSRLGPFPSGRVLYGLGVRLITFDRPGYGESAPQPGRTVAAVAADVTTIADALGIGKFAVLGRSGGGPHALACAALLEDRVTRASVLVSLAPRDAEGLDWFEGMSDSNVREYTDASSQPEMLAYRLIESADRVRANPISHVSAIGPEMPASDRRIVADAGIRAKLIESFGEALRHSAAGWIDDALAFCTPWGFDVSEIKAPVLVWHGEDDVFSPVSHAHWLARKIPNAHASISPNLAHFGALEVMPDVLSWLIRPAWQG